VKDTQYGVCPARLSQPAALFGQWPSVASLVAVGAIAPQNPALPIPAGADLSDAIAGVFTAADLAVAARAFSQPRMPRNRP
jgi:hypothetical protein